MAGKEMIKVEGLIRNYTKTGRNGEKEAINVLRSLNFAIQEQEMVAIMGKSGCGKTTLLKTLGLIDRPDGGKVYFKEFDTDELWKDELSDIRRREIGFVFQDFYLMDSLSVQENMMLPMILDKKEAKACMETSEKFAGTFGIAKLLDKHPYELSGGEKQRVAICRALINNPDVILADEPTGNLDSKSGKVVVDALKEINENMGKTIIMVTHDPQMASHCKRMIFLKDGVILEDMRREGSEDEFYQKILTKMKDL